MKKVYLTLGALVVLVALLLAANGGLAGGKAAYFDGKSPVKYFFSEQCSHCQAMKPILNSLARQGYRVAPFDVLAHPNYWDDYKITGTPTWVAANGERLEGEQTEAALGAWFDSHGARIVQ
ncbi:thioredoxin family protein [Candidatus Micrarchaeota archaeon]|nr:thioredoxin family protein [Candidatus Micrarchaeota archaeon]